MKLLTSAWAIGCMAVLGCTQFAGAAVMLGRAYEPFDYSDSPSPDNQIIAANNLNGGTGWNFGGDSSPNRSISNWDNLDAVPSAQGQSAGRTITSLGLTYTATGYPESSGNKATVDAVAGTNRVFRHLGQLVDSGTFYFSYLTERNNDTTRSAGLTFFGPSNGVFGTPGNTTERLYIGQIGNATVGAGGTNGNIGLLMNNQNSANNSTGVVNAENPIAYGTNVTHLVVGRVDFNPTGNETFMLYVDPTDVTSEPDTPYIQTSAFELTSFNSVRLFAGNAAIINSVANSAASIAFDEIRISSSWSELFSNVPIPPAPFSIFRWEYVDPSNHALGKQASTTHAQDGYGLHAAPGLPAVGRNLANAFLVGADLTDSSFNSAILTRAALEQANFTGADLSGANLAGASLSDAILTDAIVKNAKLSSTHITLDQLYSTASYEDHDLAGVHFVGNDLSGADFAGQSLASASFYAAILADADFTNANLTNADLANADLSQANLTGANFTNATLVNANLGQAILTGANFNGANLTGTNLTGADLRGAQLGGVTTYVYGYICGKPSVGGCLYYTYGVVSTEIGGGVHLAQLITTANYQTHDLSDIDLSRTNLAGANFAGFNLTNADFTNATLTEADLSGADARGASGLEGVAAPNLIRPDGHIAGLTLGGGQSLDIRDYDGGTSGTIPIIVDEQLTMAAAATLRMVFDADAWDSTISFAPGIPVMLEGNLELALADGVDPFSQIGRTFQVFDWTGVTPSGSFAIATPYVWELTNLYTTGQITFLAASGSGGNAQSSRAIPEPNTLFLLAVGLVAAWMKCSMHMTSTLGAPYVSAGKMWLIVMLLLVPGQHSFANPPSIQLTRIANPVWKPVDFQLFSAPATPFDQEFGQVYNTLLPYDTPLADTYVPHAPPYDTELSASMIAGGYVSRSLFTPDAITLQPNGVYFAYLMAPDPGTTGSSRDFTSGPIIPNSLFPIATNVDVWLDGVLVDKTPGADALIPVQPRDAVFEGTSHLEYLFVIWHPWDDDLTVGPLGNYDLRLSIRDVGGSGWDVVAPFRVSVPGDYDYSGTVGPEDYAVWKANFGSTTNLDSDGNGNHIVDAADYTIWRDHLGLTLGTGSGAARSSAGSQSSAVPEPSALFLFACGLTALFATRRAPADLLHVAGIARRL